VTDASATDPAAHAAAEAVARTQYGRLLAWLSRRTRDLAAAEDALAEALRAALETWPDRGVPDAPTAWLLTVARRNLSRGARHAGVRATALPALEMLAAEVGAAAPDLPDERLGLLFVCAHPEIEPALRAPLMLQAVLGLDAARIAGAFLVSPAAMGQRLTRAKARIRAAGLRFEIPGPEEWAPRLGAVLEAIYAAYGSAWPDMAGADRRLTGLAEEALHLARLVAALLPDDPEARGLAALILHCEARRAARRDPAGRLVPLAEQDPARWNRALFAEAEAHLSAAARAGRAGRFQLEAAIQSAHAARTVMGTTPWGAIVALYEALLRLAPSAGALLGRAAAVAEARGPAEGLALLDAMAGGLPPDWLPQWAVRAHLLARLGHAKAARDAYDRAIGLSSEPGERAFLQARRATLPR
jgi:RNA polymerase sigma-70 factor (ECF subfamily)